MRLFWKRATPAVLALCLLGTAACGNTTPPALDRRTVPGPVASDVAKPCTKEAAATGADAGASSGGSGSVAATLDRATNTITVTGGTNITLDRLSKAVGNPAALKETAPGEWLAGASIEIDKGASVAISAPDVRWLKLRSVGPTFATIKAFGGGARGHRHLHHVVGRHEAAGRHERRRRAQLPAGPRRRPDDGRQGSAGLPRLR